jgi:hypothetical protein
MRNKGELTYRKSASQELDDTPEWRRVNWARINEMEPILDRLQQQQENQQEEDQGQQEQQQQNQTISNEIQNSLRNYLVISLVSTIEVYFKSIAIKNIDNFNMNISKVVKEEVRIPLSAFEEISKDDLTRGKLIASNFNFAKLDDFDDFFSKALKIRCLKILKEFDRLDPSNYFHYAASLNRNWRSFTEMFQLRNRVVHDKQQVTLTTNQLRSL